MDTKLVQPAASRRRRRHDLEFKAQIVARRRNHRVTIPNIFR